MTDDPGLPGRVRRVGAQDRKSHIDAPDSLIPADAPAPEPIPDDALRDAPETEPALSLDEMVESILPPEAAPPAPRPRPVVRVIERPRRRSWPYNLAALLFLALACGAVAWFAVIWQNPYGAWNLFPPLTPLPVVVSMTPTISPTPIPTETVTLAPTLTPSITPTPAPTEPPTPTDIPVPATGAGSFAPVEATGRAVVFIANPEARGGCAWQSIAGSVSDLAGASLNGYQIRVLGDGVDTTAISGEATGYGPGGFEVQLGNEAREAQFAVQLLDASGTPVSEVITVPTSARCDWNISLVRFQQQAES